MVRSPAPGRRLQRRLLHGPLLDLAVLALALAASLGAGLLYGAALVQAHDAARPPTQAPCPQALATEAPR